MNYETALKLKEAGFPQLGSEWWSRRPEGQWEAYSTNEYLDDSSYFVPSDEDVLIPTLEELIGATVSGPWGAETDHFAELRANRLESLDIEYEAWSEMGKSAKGETSSEAVAALYLAIHSPGQTQSDTMEQ